MTIEAQLEAMVERIVARRLAELRPDVATLESIRRKAGFPNLNEVANASGIPVRTLRKWERRGIRKTCAEHDSMLERLARVYGCEVDVLWASMMRRAS